MALVNWETVVSRKRKEQAHFISTFVSAELSDLADHHNDYKAITDIDDIAILASKIATGQLTSENVTKAYISRAIEAHKKTHALSNEANSHKPTSLTEILFEDALHHARELDTYQTKEGKTKGPFHGIPISLKDQFNVKSYDTTLGYTGRAYNQASEDAVLVTMLKQLGAVIICKTNLPQSIMWSETDNPLWGLTENPIIPGYNPGGSSGGESALLYSHGSIVGFGSDLGGSIRMPAHALGLYGFKPSNARLPYAGVPVSTEGQEHVPSSIGPLARSLSSVYQVMRELTLLEPWTKDCRCVPIPWRQDVYDSTLKHKLTIGVLHDDGVVKPHPTIKRVMDEAAAALAADGHDLVEWNPELHAECIEVMDLYFIVDGGEDVRRAVAEGGEPYIPHVEKLINKGKSISIYEYWQLNKRKRALQQAYLEKWNSIRSTRTGKPVDAILTPAMPHSAVPHRTNRWVGYTKIWNLLDYTALVIPGGRVEPQDLEAAWDHAPRNEMDEWNFRLWEDNKHDMTENRLPVDVQLVGKVLEEEKLLAIGKVLDDLLRDK